MENTRENWERYCGMMRCAHATYLGPEFMAKVDAIHWDRNTAPDDAAWCQAWDNLIEEHDRLYTEHFNKSISELLGERRRMTQRELFAFSTSEKDGA